MAFNDVEVDTAMRQVRVAGEVAPVEPQVFDVLAHLLDHRDRVVSKEELLDEIWGSRFVSESALTSRIKTARATVGDSGREQHTIRTAHGHGYQFVAATEEISRPTSAGDGASPFGPIRRPDNGFHGRRTELAELSEHLDERRLVTVVGPGGTGKTRLGIELVHRRGDAAVFIDLAEVRDGAAVDQALVAALGIEVGAGEDEVGAATSFLRSLDVVLIVDNCEHVPEAASAMLRRILAETTAARVLATSRQPIGLHDEHVIRLEPLPLVVAGGDGGVGAVEEVAENPAAALFIDRSRQAARPIELDDATAPQVAALCRALDGLPLALELAAGRSGTFGLGDLLGRLDRRLDLLDDDRAETHERHRSLRATLDWSYDQLSSSAQQLFIHLAVFPAGLTLDAVEWVARRLDLDAEAWRVIDQLVAACLVDRVEHPSGGRFVQLETMRTFGLDRLEATGRLDAARDAQADWVLELLAALDDTGATEAEFHWNDRIRRELANIRYARRHLWARGRHRDLLAISADIEEWGSLRDVSELWTWIDELAGIDWDDDEDRASVEAMAGLAAWRRGRVAETRTRAQAASGAGSQRTRTVVAGLRSRAVANLFQGAFDDAAEGWLDCFARAGHVFDGASAALPLAYGGQIDRARETALAAHRRAVEAAWPTGIAWSCYAVGEVEATAGDPSARGWLERAVACATEIGSTFTYGVASVTLSSLLADAGEVGAAAIGYRDLITHWLRSGSWTQLWTTLRNSVALLVEVDPGLCLLTIDMADDDRLASRLDDAAAAEHDRLRDRLVDELGPSRLDELAGERALLDRVDLADKVRTALTERARSLSSPAGP